MHPVEYRRTSPKAMRRMIQILRAEFDWPCEDHLATPFMNSITQAHMDACGAKGKTAQWHSNLKEEGRLELTSRGRRVSLWKVKQEEVSDDPLLNDDQLRVIATKALSDPDLVRLINKRLEAAGYPACMQLITDAGSGGGDGSGAGGSVDDADDDGKPDPDGDGTHVPGDDDADEKDNGAPAPNPELVDVAAQFATFRPFLEQATREAVQEAQAELDEAEAAADAARAELEEATAPLRRKVDEAERALRQAADNVRVRNSTLDVFQRAIELQKAAGTNEDGDTEGT